MTSLLLLLLGSLLFAQQTTAQFDYNSTLLGTVSTFINVSTIPGNWRSLTCTSHYCYCPGCLSSRQLRQATAFAHLHAHMPHICVHSVRPTSPLKHYEYELYCFLTFKHIARVTRHWASFGISFSRAADLVHVHMHVHLKLKQLSWVVLALTDRFVAQLMQAVTTSCLTITTRR